MILVRELLDPAKLRLPSAPHLLTVVPRYGHTLLSDNRGSLWLFGGYSLSRGPLNDILRYHTPSDTWKQVSFRSILLTGTEKGVSYIGIHRTQIVQGN